MEVVDILVVDDEPGIRSGVTRILGTHVTPFLEDDIALMLLKRPGEEAPILSSVRVQPLYYSIINYQAFRGLRFCSSSTRITPIYW